MVAVAIDKAEDDYVHYADGSIAWAFVLRDCESCGSAGAVERGRLLLCGPCKKERWRKQSADWRRNNRERTRVYSRKWREENPDKNKECVRRWREQNKAHLRQYARQYQRVYYHKRLKHDEGYLSYRSEYNRRPEVKLRARQRYRSEKYRASKANRQARLRGAKGKVDAEGWKDVLGMSQGMCFYCGEEKELQMDHVIAVNGGGEHDKSNIVASCGYCNASKGDREVGSWLRWKYGYGLG